MAGVMSKVISLPIKLLATASLEPIVTGILLYILTRGSSDTRAQISVRTGISITRIGALVTPLNWLFGIGLVRKLHNAMDNLAHNNWQIRRQGEPWRFGDEKLSELVVITGGCSGFGHLMVKDFVGQARVVVLDVQELPEDLEGLPGVHYFNCDLSEPSQIQDVAAKIRNEHGDPSVLINNAGIARSISLLDAPTEYTQQIFAVNTLAHLHLIKQFLPGMLSARKGHIVTVASIASYLSMPPIIHYCATKTAANYISDGLRSELLTLYPNGNTILTTSVHPTFHDTPMTRNLVGNAKTARNKSDVIYPAENVSKKVVQQVLQAKSGKLFMPEGQYWVSFMKFAPIWLMDLIVFLRASKKRKEMARAAAEAS